MASHNDIVECNCGSLEALPKNTRVPMHKTPGTKFNCRWSGAEAENWDPVSRCPGCACTDQVRNAPPGSPKPFVCGACGELGDLVTFINVRKLRKQPKPQEKSGKHRYQDRPKAPKGVTNPPRCPACESRRIVRAPADATYPFVCQDCGTAGQLNEFVVALPAPAPALSPTALAVGGDVYVQPVKKVVPDRDVRGELQVMFAGKLSEDDIADLYDAAESAAKKAFAERKQASKMLGYRAYDPMLDTFQERFDKLADRVAARKSEDASDFAYLAYWGVLEEEARRAGVPFRREDMAARGL